MRGLGHELVRLHDRDLGEPAEVRLEAPDALVGRHHRVVVRRRVLVVDVEAVRRHPVAGFQLRTADPTRSTTPDASEPITWNGWSWRAPHTLSRAEPLQEPEGRQRLEDRRPDRVEVDGRRHHGHVRLVGRELGQRELLDVGGLAGVLLLRLQAGEHLDLVGLHQRTAGGRGQRQRRELVGGRAGDDRVADGFDLALSSRHDLEATGQ